MENNGVPQPGAGQQAIANTGSVIEPVVPAVPATPAAAPLPPATPAAAPLQSFSGGGSTGKKFFDGITLMDVIIGAGVVCALALAIKYYRDRMKHAKVEYPELRSDIERLDKKLEDQTNPEVRTSFG